VAVTKKFILEQLPKFRDERVLIAESQQVRRDIIPTLLRAHKENAWLYDKIGCYFIGDTIDETCANIYDFLKESLRYDEESDQLQTVAVPQALLTWGHCDCKGFASFACGVIDAVSRYTDSRIDWHYSFASYKFTERTPYHVFCVVDTDSGPIWIDPTPGAKGKTPVWWINKTVKTSDMLEQVVGKIDNGGGYRVGATLSDSTLQSRQASVYDFGTTAAAPIPALSQDQQDLAASVLLSTETAGTQ